MDFIRVLRHNVPAASDIEGAGVPTAAAVSEPSAPQKNTAATNLPDDIGPLYDAEAATGGLSHFLEADCFFRSMNRLIASAHHVCAYSKATLTVASAGARDSAGTPTSRVRIIGTQEIQDNPDTLAKPSSPINTKGNTIGNGPDTLDIERVVREVSSCIKDSAAAVAFCVATLEIYQSQPTLLDPYLSQIVKPLCETVADNLELLTPLSVTELEAALSQVFSHISSKEQVVAVPLGSLSTSTVSMSFQPSSSPPTSSGTSRPSPPLQCLHVSASSQLISSSARSSYSTDTCGDSHDAAVSQEEFAVSAASPASKSAALCPATGRGLFVECAAVSESSSPVVDTITAVIEAEKLFLRTTASVALRLLLHLLYVVCKVRGYKIVRQLLLSEPELLEVFVEHCERLLNAEYPLSRIAAENSTVIGGGTPARAMSSEESRVSKSVVEECSNPDAIQGIHAELVKTEKNSWKSPVTAVLVLDQMNNIIDLIRQLPLWSTHYTLLVWLSLLVLAPFDFDSLDSSAPSGTSTQDYQQTSASVAGPCHGAVAHSGERSLTPTSAQQHGENKNAESCEDVASSKSTGHNTGVPPDFRLPLRSRIIVLVQQYLCRTSNKASDAAAFVAARFFARPDVGTKAAHTCFSAFLHFSQEVLLDEGNISTLPVDNKKAISGEERADSSTGLLLSTHHSASSAAPLFAKANVMRALNETLKNIPRESAIPELPRLLYLVGIGERASAEKGTIAQQANSNEIGDKFFSEKATKSALFRKLRCSCAARICMLLLPPVGSGAYQWRYTRHARNLEAYLKQSQLQGPHTQQPQGHHNMAESPGTHAPESAQETNHRRYTMEDSVQEEDVPDAVEEVVGLLLGSLGDRDTIVRWAAAKAIGRVVLQLPRSFAMQVVASVLDQMTETATYTRTAGEERLWHGGCLALGELLRRGLVDPSEHLAACSSRLCSALALYSTDRDRPFHSSTYSAAAAAEQLRDAACFAVWCLARAYHHTEALQLQIKPLSEALLLVALFDREVNCRRAAAAAFQELEGRQSGILHGLQIVTMADFFALATRRSAYLKVAPQVAALDTSYSDLLLDSLVHLLLQQSDEEMRTLAGAAIKRIAKLKDKAITECYMEMLLRKAAAESESLPLRHGALLGLTAFVEALGSDSSSMGEKQGIPISKEATIYRPTPISVHRDNSPATRSLIGSDADKGTSATRLRTNAQGMLTDGFSQKLPCAKTASQADACWEYKSASKGGTVVGGAPSILGDKLQTSLRQLVIQIEKQRLYRGKGGDMIRTGVCVYIQALATASYIVFKPTTARRYISTLLEGLRHFSDSVQLAAAEALRALLRMRMTAEEALQEVVPQLLQHLQNASEHVAARRGYVLALATLPAEVYCRACINSSNSNERLDLLTVLQTEATSLAPLGCPSLADAQTRRNALIALAFALRAVFTSPLRSVSTIPANGKLKAAAEEKLPHDQIQKEGGLSLGRERRPNTAVETPVAVAVVASQGALVKEAVRQGCDTTKDVSERYEDKGRDLPPWATVEAAVGEAAGGFTSVAAAPTSTTKSAVPPFIFAKVKRGGVTSIEDSNPATTAKPLESAEEKEKAEERAVEMCSHEQQRSDNLSKLSASLLERMVCKTLEACSVDFQVDKRGDVGSWVREVAAEVITFLLENCLQTACSCCCPVDFASSERHYIRGNKRQMAPTEEVRGQLEKSLCASTRNDREHTCMRARLLSVLIRMSLESLDRTRSRAVFLLYHLVAPLPTTVFCDGRPPSLTPFKVEWIWSRVFYDFAYEAISANLTPRLNLLQAGPSACFIMHSHKRKTASWGTTNVSEAKGSSTAEVSAVPLKGCVFLITLLQRALLPLAEEQANALESVKPHIPFHNLNLSEFASSSQGVVLADPVDSIQKTVALPSSVTSVQAGSDMQHAINATSEPVNGAPADVRRSVSFPVDPEYPAHQNGADTKVKKGSPVKSGNAPGESPNGLSLCERVAGEADIATSASERADADFSQPTSPRKAVGSNKEKEYAAGGVDAEDTLSVDIYEIADKPPCSVGDQGSFDFLLEVSAGDGGRASLNKTRKAGVLLRLPLFTDAALTYPPLLLTLLTAPPFCEAAAQGVCLGVGAFAGRSSERAAQAMLVFLTELPQAAASRGKGLGIGDEGDKRADVIIKGGRSKQHTCELVALLQSHGAFHANEGHAAQRDHLSSGGGRTLACKEVATTVHRVGRLIVDVLEECASVHANKAFRGEARSGLHSEKTCLAALRTITLISSFLSENDRYRVMEISMEMIDEGAWRRSFQYAKARCEALIALLAAGSQSASPGECLEAATGVHCSDSTIVVHREVATAQNGRTVHKKALCAALQYLTHSFPKLRQFAAEELYASLLLPLSATHAVFPYPGAVEVAGTRHPSQDSERSTCRSTSQPEMCRLRVASPPHVEVACQIVIGTPWMESSASGASAVETLVRLFDACSEWDEMQCRKGRH